MKWLIMLFVLTELFIAIDLTHAQRMYWDGPAGKVYGGGVNVEFGPENSNAKGVHLTYSPKNTMEVGLSAHEATIGGKSTGTFGFHLNGYSSYKVLRPFVNISLMRNTNTDEFYKYAARMSGGLAAPVINTDKMIIAPEFAPSYVIIIDERSQEKPQLVWGIGLNAGIKMETNFVMFFWNMGIHKGDITNSLGLGLMFQ